MRLWWRLRAWWHANRHHPTDVMPDPVGAMINCSCGGHGYVIRNGDGTWTVQDATCPVWKWRRRYKPLILPVATVR